MEAIEASRGIGHSGQPHDLVQHVAVDVAHEVSDMHEAQLALEADSSEYSEDETGGMAVTLDLDTVYDEIMAELAMERS